MHYQLAPFSEKKLVYCLQGALYDVILDLRINSATFGQCFSCVLEKKNHKMLYIPQGCAHGFITLEKNTEILYVLSHTYQKDYERGVRWDDAFFKISWPCMPEVISERDRNHPYFNYPHHLGIEGLCQ